MTPHPLRRLKDIATIHLPLLIKVELKRLFPALYDRVPIRPSAAWLNPTDNCNMRCIMCNQWRVTKTDELTTAEWKDVVAQLRAEGIAKVGLNGGEPLLRKDLAEIVGEITRQGMNAALITSGYLLDEKKMESLLAAGLKHVTLSIDGTGAEYEKIRGREWARVERAAEIIAREFKAGRIDANIGFVVMKPTLGHLDGVRALTKRLGLPLMFSLVDSTPYFLNVQENQDTHWIGRKDLPRVRELQQKLVHMKAEDHYGTVNTYADIGYMSDYFQDPLQAAVPCTVSQVRIMINSHGEVYGGCWSMGSWGCLRKQRLKEILASEAYRNAHKGMFYKRCPGCSCGYTTNVRYSMPLQVKDRLYTLLPSLRKRIYQDAADGTAVR